jgi:hypothetical protein
MLAPGSDVRALAAPLLLLAKKYHVLFDTTIELSNKDLKTTSDSDCLVAQRVLVIKGQTA